MSIIYLDWKDIRAVRVFSEARPNPYAFGYGRKIPTNKMLQLQDGRWRRIYVACYSNNGTAYVLVKGEWRVIGPSAESRMDYMLGKGRGF